MEDFVSFEIANKLKEKGFRKPCILYYNSDKVRTWFNEPDIAKNFVPTTLGNDDVLAPTISQVLKWLREEKNIFIEIFLYNGKYSHFIKSVTQICKDDLFHKCLDEDTEEEYTTYEQAALAGIEYSLDNLI